MLKKLKKGIYRFLRWPVERLERQIGALQHDSEELRARVIAAQDAKAEALKQADDLRKQKERLRLKVSALKKDLETQVRVAERLQSKIQALQKENAELKIRD